MGGRGDGEEGRKKQNCSCVSYGKTERKLKYLPIRWSSEQCDVIYGVAMLFDFELGYMYKYSGHSTNPNCALSHPSCQFYVNV